MGRVLRGMNARNIGFRQEREKTLRERYEQKANNQDTIIRTEIQGIIFNGVDQGIDREIIIEKLSTNPRYEKYQQFFGAWVDNVISKSETQKQRQADQEKDK